MFMGRQNVDIVRPIFRTSYSNVLEVRLSEEHLSKMDYKLQLFLLNDGSPPVWDASPSGG